MVINVNRPILEETLFVPSNNTLPKFNRRKFVISCNPNSGRNFFEDPYIKIYDNGSFEKASGDVRVHLVSMGLDYSHKDSKGNLILSNEDLDTLNDIMKLNSRYHDPRDHNKTLTVEEAIWKYLEYQAIINGRTVAKYGNIDFKKCFILPGKEP